MKVALEIDKGASVGARYDLEMHAYRAVVRAGGRDVTAQLSESGERQLDPDDLRVVEAHLARRDDEGEESTSLRIGSFRRGRDILLNDDKISRTHAMFFLDEAGPSVVDLLSTNGTHVNGARVGDTDLHDGDIVHIGKTRFVVHLQR